jgi:hypothetical protein
LQRLRSDSRTSSAAAGLATRRRLKELGFLKAGAPSTRSGRTASSLLALCHAGRLHGGLSIAISATPDEVLGGLTAAMGGAAKSLRLEDVRGTGPFELHVRTREGLEKWEVAGLEGLVHNLDDLFRTDSSVRACAVLGEWEDMLQLWCLDRLRLLALLQERWFEPRNRAGLEQMVG